jgi:hypothetical protein
MSFGASGLAVALVGKEMEVFALTWAEVVTADALTPAAATVPPRRIANLLVMPDKNALLLLSIMPHLNPE